MFCVRSAMLPALILSVLALAAVPSLASAQTYYAEAAGSGAATGCTLAASNCSLNAAVTAARASTATDTIVLDAGTHSLTTVLSSTGDVDTTLQGQGLGQTTITGGATVVDWHPASPGDQLTLKSLTVSATNPTAAGSAVWLESGTVVLDGVQLSRSANASGAGYGLRVDQTTTAHVQNGSLLTSAGPINAYTNGTLTVADSTLTRTAPSTPPLIENDYGLVTLARTRLDGDGGSGIGVLLQPVLVNRDSYATLQDVAIVGTGIGVLATRAGSGGGNASVIANLDHVTIAPALSSTPSVKTDPAFADLTTFKLRVNVRNSILATAPAYVDNNSHEGTFCDWTAVPTDPNLDYGTFRECTKDSVDDTSVTRHNVVYAAGMLTAAGTLPATSPAIDAADPAALGSVLAPTPPATYPPAIVESTTDLAGSPRVLRGTCTASARRDLGAYEYQGAATTASGAISAADAATTLSPIPFAYTSPDAIASVAWAFGDGVTSTQAAPFHRFDTVGTKDVALTLTPTTGCPVTLHKTVTVTADPGDPGPSGGGSGGAGGAGTTDGPGANGPASPGGGQSGPPLTPAPQLSAVRLAPTSVTAQKPARLTFTATVAGTVAGALTKTLKGRKTGKRCVKLAHGQKGSCTYAVTVGTVRYAAKAGANTVTFAVSKKLKPGTYGLALTLRDASGATAAAVRSTFTVKAVPASKKKKR